MTREELREYHRNYQREYRRTHHAECIAISRAYRRRKAAERGPVTATCAVCGKTFVKTGHFQVCCSAECARARKNEKERTTRVRAPRTSHSALRTPHSAVCAVCGKAFAAKTSRAKFCSRKCHHDFFNACRKRPTLTKICPVCGKVFETTRTDKVYCSKSCYKASQRRELQPVERVCVFCGKAFSTLSRTAKFCSTVCASRSHSGYKDLADFEKTQSERKAAFNKQHERDRNGLTLAQIQEVFDAQNGDPALLWKRSQSWSKAQHKYAKKRYQDTHGLFVSTYNP